MGLGVLWVCSMLHMDMHIYDIGDCIHLVRMVWLPLLLQKRGPDIYTYRTAEGVKRLWTWIFMDLKGLQMTIS